MTFQSFCGTDPYSFHSYSFNTILIHPFSRRFSHILPFKSLSRDLARVSSHTDINCLHIILTTRKRPALYFFQSAAGFSFFIIIVSFFTNYKPFDIAAKLPFPSHSPEKSETNP